LDNSLRLARVSGNGAAAPSTPVGFPFFRGCFGLALGGEAVPFSLAASRLLAASFAFFRCAVSSHPEAGRFFFFFFFFLAGVTAKGVAAGALLGAGCGMLRPLHEVAPPSDKSSGCAPLVIGPSDGRISASAARTTAGICELQQL
jgi:hypothetical protein